MPSLTIARAMLPAALLAAVAVAAQSPLDRPAAAWAAESIGGEQQLIEHPGSWLRYRMHQVDDKGDSVRDQIETPQGTVARLILRNGQPLTAEEDAAERERLQAELNNPAGFERHVRREQENKEMGIRLLGRMPDAMLYSYAPGQPQLTAASGGSNPPLVVLDFKPNPQWSPPDMESEVLTGLEGRVWIDPRSRHLIHIEGRLTRAVNIGWGMVAHLYPGGAAVLDQADVGNGRWIVTHIDERITLRALLVKTVKQRLVYDTSEIRPVPTMTWQQAIHLLLDTPSPSHPATAH